MSLDPQQTAQLRAPVGPKASFDAAKVRGLHGYDETSDCPTTCPGDGLDYKRSMVHPSDVPAAAPLSGSETITALQGSGLVRTTLQAIADLVGSGLYQPLDADLTAIAALSTQAFGRSLLVQADALAARKTLAAGCLFGGSEIAANINSTPSTVATITVPANTFGNPWKVLDVELTGWNDSAGVAQTFLVKWDTTTIATVVTSGAYQQPFYVKFRVFRLTAGSIAFGAISTLANGTLTHAGTATIEDSTVDHTLTVVASAPSSVTCRGAFHAIAN